ncbi:hypothetical protein CONLIGDRAFT_241127 [Coniochaeta ligniaria NRRL 30616]|uniref:Zn(2)-C6 fungal-type domain-containing protein n=1 Tax=Coniochaeta ligniaria NRRL 30616 TaxID=1408157 RepID=A0A1J7IX80_9PEZI|nr:hypothetical protein CONLIGDRAFT_241127 [Coniochaeta ligniaria NRRL 30616]
MQVLEHRHDISKTSLGNRRGQPDLARFSIDLTWARADSESAARSKDYPSPPMSGSPPPPPKGNQESAAERRQGSYHATTHDAHRGIPATQMDAQPYRAGVGGGTLGRSFEAEPQERLSYAFPRPESSTDRPPTYHQQAQHMHQQSQSMHQQLSYLASPGPGVGPGAGPSAYPLAATTSSTASRPTTEQQEGSLQASPKLQRKTKGHVASACVPCKRAHLRCDAQRPCSRCISNGKEDACVDVQHKKRGRPRLRDDPSRFAGYPEAPIMRRPLSLSSYSTSPAMGGGYEDSIRRNQSQSYRVLKSQPPEPAPPRFIERGSASDANVFPAPLSISTRPPEPAAFLTMDLEIARASSTFFDALSRSGMKGLKLTDVIAPGDIEKVVGYQRQMQEEQQRRDPSYLPPIFGKEAEDRVIQALGFSPEDIARYSLDRQDYLTFVTQEGQQRPYPIRMGLAKQDSIYFVVLTLNLAMRAFQPPTPSPNPRDITYSYQPMPQPYSQPTPVSATFDPRHQRMNDPGYPLRRSSHPGGSSQMMSGLSPGFPVSYAASPNRQDYPGQPPYQGPRSELAPPITTSRPSQMQGYQLPPIISQQQSTGSQPPEQTQQSRDDRRRVGIGGLIDQPDPSSRPHR